MHERVRLRTRVYYEGDNVVISRIVRAQVRTVRMRAQTRRPDYIERVGACTREKNLRRQQDYLLDCTSFCDCKCSRRKFLSVMI